MPLSAHTHLGPYEILAPIGAGGMGEVYKARDTRLDRIVAIKVLSARHSAPEVIRERFEREGCAISRLNHPHICRLYDVGAQDDTNYLVMEYLEGETLAARLQKGHLPVAQALTYAVQILSGLDRAHRSGMVHRDVKPGNIMLTADGAKLLDFGLAKVNVPQAAVGDRTAVATRTAALTAEGAIVGTMAYMAPEQLEGKPTDARSDIFAFGAVLYEMLTGRQAFEGSSQASLIAAIMSAEPTPISVLQPVASPTLDRVVASCLAKNPDQRWQSAHDVLLNLQSIGTTESQIAIAGPVPARPKFREHVWQALAVMAAIAAIWIGILHNRQVDSQKGFPMHLALPLTGDFSFGPLDHPVISPDARRVCFCAMTKAGKPMLWVHSLDSMTTQAIAGTENCGNPFWSNDGRTIAFFTENQLKKVDLARGAVLTIAQLPAEGTGGTWNADNVIVFGMDERPLHRVPATSGTPTPVLALDASRQEIEHSRPRFLPDGHHLVYFAQSRDRANSRMMAASLDGTQQHISLQANGAFYAVGYLVFPRGSTVMAQRFDTATLKVSGDPYPLVEDAIARMSVSNDGVLAYRPSESSDQEIVLYERGGKRIGNVGPSRNYRGLKISPDNQRLLLTVEDNRAVDVWLLEIGTGILSRMTFDTATDEDPVWSPDGKQFVFDSTRQGRFGVYRKTIGRGEEEAFFATDASIHSEEWLSDGTLIYHNDEREEVRPRLGLWPAERIGSAREPIQEGWTACVPGRPLDRVHVR